MEKVKKMYFAVFLEDVEKYIVVPPHWIKDGKAIWEKFVNYGVNSNQTYLCYYKRKNGNFSEDAGADFDFEPNFGACLTAEYPSVGLAACYRCNIRRFFYGKYFSFQMPERVKSW